MGAAGPHQSRRPRWRRAAASACEIDTGAGADPRAGHDAVRDPALANRRSGCSSWPSRAASPRSRRSAPSGSSTPRRSARSPTTASSASRTTASPSSAIPGQRLVDDCPIYHPEAREAPRPRSPAAPATPPARARRRASRAPCALLLDTPDHRQQALGVRAVRLDGAGLDRHRPGRRRRRAPGAGHRLRPRGDGGLQQPAAWRSIRTRAARPRSPRRRATSPAPARVPLGITDCLNFGNPEKPEVFFQFREACRGIADACRAFDTPVTGGNVSFYNESPTGAVDPTPTVGMVGLLETIDHRVPQPLPQRRATAIVLLGDTAGAAGRLGATGRSSTASSAARRRRSTSTPSDALQRFLVAAARDEAAPLGARLQRRRPGRGARRVRRSAGRTPPAAHRRRRSTSRPTRRTLEPQRLLFGEDQGARGRHLCPRPSADRVVALAAEHGVPACRGGHGRASGTAPLAITAAGQRHAGSGRWTTFAASISTRFRGECSTSRRHAALEA